MLIIATHAFPSSIIPGTGVCFFQNTTYLPTRLPEKRARKGIPASSFRPAIVNAMLRRSNTFAFQASNRPTIIRQRNRQKNPEHSCAAIAPFPPTQSSRDPTTLTYRARPRLSTNIVGRRAGHVHATRHCPSSGNPQMRSPKNPNAFFDSGCLSPHGPNRCCQRERSNDSRIGVRLRSYHQPTWFRSDPAPSSVSISSFP